MKKNERTEAAREAVTNELDRLVKAHGFPAAAEPAAPLRKSHNCPKCGEALEPGENWKNAHPAARKERDG